MRKITMVLTLALTLLTAGLALAHGGHGHVMGTVSAVTAGHIEVKTRDGKTVTVPLTAATKYMRGDRKATSTGIRTGERVVVHLGAKGAAEEVRLSAGKAAAAHPH